MVERLTYDEVSVILVSLGHWIDELENVVEKERGLCLLHLSRAERDLIEAKSVYEKIEWILQEY